MSKPKLNPTEPNKTKTNEKKNPSKVNGKQRIHVYTERETQNCYLSMNLNSNTNSDPSLLGRNKCDAFNVHDNSNKNITTTATKTMTTTKKIKEMEDYLGLVQMCAEID